VAPVAVAATATAAAVPGADAVKSYVGNVTVEALLQVVSQGPWTPANSNGLEVALLLQLQFHRDDYPDPLQSMVYSPKIVSVVPRGPAARRLMAAQVRRRLNVLPTAAKLAPYCKQAKDSLVPGILELSLLQLGQNCACCSCC
jgi:hypothetical protein